MKEGRNKRHSCGDCVTIDRRREIMFSFKFELDWVPCVRVYT